MRQTDGTSARHWIGQENLLSKSDIESKRTKPVRMLANPETLRLRVQNNSEGRRLLQIALKLRDTVKLQSDTNEDEKP